MPFIYLIFIITNTQIPPSYKHKQLPLGKKKYGHNAWSGSTQNMLSVIYVTSKKRKISYNLFS